MSKICLILPDQLSHDISSLDGYDSKKDVVVICEVMDEFTYVHHHKKKIAFFMSAMRHFSIALQDKGYKVEYVKLDDKENTGSLKHEVKRFIKKYNYDSIVITHPGEYRILSDILKWEKDLGVSVEIREDNRFLCTKDEFARWAKGRKQLRMEYFYREMRIKYSILMQGNKPEGGQWNYDAENRQPPKEGLIIPETYSNPKDNISKAVIDLVEEKFANHFGDLEPFYFAVTRDQARKALKLFIKERLQNFGHYQDAMIEGEPWMYHSHLSFYLNCGLLSPLECVEEAEEAYKKGSAQLNAVEGFIRQIIGWREYIRGIYWLKMPSYADENFFGATRKLPDFYWTADTKMNCLKQCVSEIKKNAYAHHIQRLMVLGNFALIFGIDPKYVNEWFLIVYADAYEWVEMPNVTGMILFADGGYLASKPYAASGSYINKMSNYCKNCQYNVKEKDTANSCPFNYLYWDFLVRNRKKLESNHRIGMMYRTYDRMDSRKKKNIREASMSFINLHCNQK